MERILKKNYQEIFEEELEAWMRDDTCWPEDRSFKVFKKWFHIDLVAMVVETADDEFNIDAYEQIGRASCRERV